VHTIVFAIFANGFVFVCTKTVLTINDLTILLRRYYKYIMAVNKELYLAIKSACDSKGVTLVAVSKIQSNESIMQLYELGHRDFGENYVQELIAKHEALPKDIRWHFIGHLQSNKVKMIAPFVHLIHGVDSLKLLTEINKQAAKINRTIDCLLQVHIAKEKTKFGFDAAEIKDVFVSLANVENAQVKGLMGMASFSDDMNVVRNEFKQLKTIYDSCLFDNSSYLSMGMSADYAIAIEEGSNMVRVGSLLFGARPAKL
jgi:pyridoxal phosphate enzyme (YggS family)